jgi:hypothetical protein
LLFGLLLQPKVELEGLAKGIELVEHTEAKQVGPGSARTSALGPPPTPQTACLTLPPRTRKWCPCGSTPDSQ